MDWDGGACCGTGADAEPDASRPSCTAGSRARCWARLHLCVLVGDEVAAMKFIGLQAVVEGECIERHCKRDCGRGRQWRVAPGGAAWCFLRWVQQGSSRVSVPRASV